MTLRELIKQIQSYPPKSIPRMQLMNQLVCSIQNFNQLSYYHQLLPDNLRDNYEEIYVEAKQRLFIWMNQKIDSYDENRGEVMTWVNNKLRYLMLDVIREFKENSLNEIPIFSLDDLDQLLPIIRDNSENLSLSEQIINIIEEDPEGKFKSAYTGNKTEANFQFICLKRYEGYQWQELSDILTLPIPNLSNFYQRKLKEFTPLIQFYLRE